MKNTIIYLIFLCLINFNVQALMLYTLSNHDNSGDHNQVLGIITALKRLSDQGIIVKDLNTTIMDASKIKNEIKKNLPHEKIIVIGAGEGAIDGVAELPANLNLIICLTSHMFLERYKDPNLLEKVRFIALPKHVTNDIKEQLGSKLIETTGVAHNRQPEEVTKVYEKWGEQELLPCKTYLGVILGGDAPLPGSTKDIKLFTKKDAMQLAGYLFRHAREACILVLNGPRTGKYDKDKNEILTVHRKGYSDRVTKFFQEQLLGGGIKNVKVFDFQHNTPENKPWVSPYNAFELVIGALRETNGEVLVPGDSTSMISEAIDMLPPGKVLVYETSSMNEVHKAHLASELAAGRISILNSAHELTFPSLNSDTPQLNAAMTIAQKICEEVRQEK